MIWILVLFVCSSLVIAAILLFFTDLLTRRRRAALENESVEVPQFAAELRSHDANPGDVGQRFDRVVAESGAGIDSDSAFLLVILSGLIVGGCLMFWRDSAILGLAGLFVGMIVVVLYFSYRRTRRFNSIQQQLPDVMELMARAVRAGESLDQAIHLVGETTVDPLGTELRRCDRQLQMGLSVDSAMRSLTGRAPLVETRILAATLTVQRRAGGNLPVTLERLAKVIRDRISYHRQYRAATAASRFAAGMIVVAAVFVSVYFLIWQPDYIRNFMVFPGGKVLLAAAIVLQIVGLVWVWRLLKSDY